jgi:hypothetical protein
LGLTLGLFFTFGEKGIYAAGLFGAGLILSKIKTSLDSRKIHPEA